MVTDRYGKVEQHTGYYPYGEPWREPDGQPWLYGGKERRRDNGLNEYELPRLVALSHTASQPRFYLTFVRQNGLTCAKSLDELAKARFSARRLNSALCLWTTSDPLAPKFANTNPYVYCIANPIKFIDPSGKDIWQLDDRGYFTLVEKNDDEFNTILGRENASIQVEKGFMESVLNFDGKNKDSLYKVSLYKLDTNASKLFEFLADNSNVEWSRAKLITGVNYIGTSHDPGSDGSIDILRQKLPEDFKLIHIYVHNHPNGSSEPSPADLAFANFFSENEIRVKFMVYTTQEKYVPNKLFPPLYLHYTYYYPN